MEGGDHGRLGYTGDQAFIHGRSRRDAQAMAIETSFAKKLTRSQNGDYGFLSLFGNHRELELAFLNIENRVREVALRENNLILLILRYRFSLTDSGKKFLGLKRDLAYLCHGDLHWPRRWCGEASRKLYRSQGLDAQRAFGVLRSAPHGRCAPATC